MHVRFDTLINYKFYYSHRVDRIINKTKNVIVINKKLNLILVYIIECFELLKR